MYQAPVEDMKFVLRNLVGIHGVAALDGMDMVSEDLVDAVLEDTAQSNLCLIFISSSMKKFTVLPVPIPRIVSFVNLDSICSIVASATLLFK